MKKSLKKYIRDLEILVSLQECLIDSLLDQQDDLISRLSELRVNTIKEAEPWPAVKDRYV